MRKVTKNDKTKIKGKETENKTIFFSRKFFMFFEFYLSSLCAIYL